MSIFDAGTDVPDAPTWRCPHCRTLQPETSRCRACLRATVTCATCRHFRPSLVNDLGLCADDPGRSPLSSDEVHPCWTSATDTMWSGSGLLDGPGPALLELVPAPTSVPLGATTPRPDLEPTHPPRLIEPSTVSAPPGGGFLDAPRVPPARLLRSGLRPRFVRDRG